MKVATPLVEFTCMPPHKVIPLDREISLQEIEIAVQEPAELVQYIKFAKDYPQTIPIRRHSRLES